MQCFNAMGIFGLFIYKLFVNINSLLFQNGLIASKSILVFPFNGTTLLFFFVDFNCLEAKLQKILQKILGHLDKDNHWLSRAQEMGQNVCACNIWTFVNEEHLMDANMTSPLRFIKGFFHLIILDCLSQYKLFLD